MTHETLTQREQVLNHLRNVGPLSQMECTRLFCATRLSAIVFDLRSDGYEIDMERKYSSKGRPFGLYHLVTEQRDMFGESK